MNKHFPPQKKISSIFVDFFVTNYVVSFSKSLAKNQCHGNCLWNIIERRSFMVIWLLFAIRDFFRALGWEFVWEEILLE